MIIWLANLLMNDLTENHLNSPKTFHTLTMCVMTKCYCDLFLHLST